MELGEGVGSLEKQVDLGDEGARPPGITFGAQQLNSLCQHPPSILIAVGSVFTECRDQREVERSSKSQR